MSEPEPLRCEVRDHVATVTLDRPPVNAMSAGLASAITRTFDALGSDDEVRAAVLTGAGKCFCAGVDMLDRPPERDEPGFRSRAARQGRETFNSILDCRVPVIAALNGPALGAGLCLAASCDILVASERGSLGLPEIGVGLLGGGRHAMRLFGHSRARRMMLTGQRVEGPELHRLGVVEACVAQDDLLEVSLGIAREIAEKSPLATRMAKRGMNAIELMELRDGYRYEQNLTAELSRSEDSKEAARAFREKRKPVFTGK